MSYRYRQRKKAIKRSKWDFTKLIERFGKVILSKPYYDEGAKYKGVVDKNAVLKFKRTTRFTSKEVSA